MYVISLLINCSLRTFVEARGFVPFAKFKQKQTTQPSKPSSSKPFRQPSKSSSRLNHKLRVVQTFRLLTGGNAVRAARPKTNAFIVRRFLQSLERWLNVLCRKPASAVAIWSFCILALKKGTSGCWFKRADSPGRNARICQAKLVSRALVLKSLYQ